MKVKFKEIMESEGCERAIVEIEGFNEPVAFTLTKERDIYLENQDGGALQDSEREFYRLLRDALSIEKLLI